MLRTRGVWTHRASTDMKWCACDGYVDSTLTFFGEAGWSPPARNVAGLARMQGAPEDAARSMCAPGFIKATSQVGVGAIPHQQLLGAVIHRLRLGLPPTTGLEYCAQRYRKQASRKHALVLRSGRYCFTLGGTARWPGWRGGHSAAGDLPCASRRQEELHLPSIRVASRQQSRGMD